MMRKHHYASGESYHQREEEAHASAAMIPLQTAKDVPYGEA